MERTLRRLAHEIVEKNRGVQNLCLIGILRRGVPLAQRLAANIQMIENEETSGIDPKLVLGAAVIAGAAIVGGIKHLKSKKNKPADDKPKTKKKIHLRAPWTITEETVPEKTEDADKEAVEEPSDEEE